MRALSEPLKAPLNALPTRGRRTLDKFDSGLEGQGQVLASISCARCVRVRMRNNARHDGPYVYEIGFVPIPFVRHSRVDL